MQSSAVKFLIESTLKAEREVIEQRKVNAASLNQLSNLQTILEARRSTVLDAENSAHKAAARLCDLRYEVLKLKEEEVCERKRVELEAELLRLSIIHHREVHVMSEVHCTSLNDKHQRILNYFQAAPELQTLAQLKLLEQGWQRGTHVEDIITGLKDYDADTRTENLAQRQLLLESEDSVHQLRLKLKQVLEASEEATRSFEREADSLDEEILARQQQQIKANKELQQLEREASTQMVRNSHLEREQRRLRQEQRDL